MKLRMPINFVSAILGAIIYLAFATLAYINYPLPLSPWRNWLSDLGDQIVNPHGAIFYNTGIMLTALCLGIWFTAGLSQWRLKDNTAHQRLLLISRTAGILAAFALVMSAIYPINLPQVHSFWSKMHFIMFGVGFGFSVAALRYHPRFSNAILFVGVGASVLPLLMFVFDKFWLEWVAVGLFIFYILSVGKASLTFSRESYNSMSGAFITSVR